TLGFAWEVSKLTANTSVVNAGNWSVPPPPPPWWQLFWNMIAGWPEVVWKAVVAVKVFFRLQGARVIWLDLLGPPDEVIRSLFQETLPTVSAADPSRGPPVRGSYKS